MEKLLTVDEFLQIAERTEGRIELIHGEMVPMSPSEIHSLIVANILARLWNYNQTHNLGRVHTEAMYSTDDQNARIPDVSFTGAERLRPVVERGTIPHMPDLAVEVKSPGNTYDTLRDKAAYYLANGARLVWLIFPTRREVEIHRAAAAPQILGETDRLTGGDVLPGFSVSVADLFEYRA